MDQHFEENTFFDRIDDQNNNLFVIQTFEYIRHECQVSKHTIKINAHNEVWYIHHYVYIWNGDQKFKISTFICLHSNFIPFHLFDICKKMTYVDICVILIITNNTFWWLIIALATLQLCSEYKCRCQYYTNIDCSWGEWWKIIVPRQNSTLAFYSPRPVGPRWIVGQGWVLPRVQ